MTTPARRRVAFALSIGLHLLLLALLLGWGSNPTPPKKAGGINVLEMISERDEEAQLAQEAEDPLVDVSTVPAASEFPVEIPQLAVNAASTGQFGEACGISAAIQADLLVDPAARGELMAIPFDERSVAHAIMLWKPAPDPALETIRDLFAQGVAQPYVRPALPAVDAVLLKRLQAVPEACLDLEQKGPEFIYFTGDTQTISITIGSGKWRWRNFFEFLSTALQPSSVVERLSPRD